MCQDIIKIIYRGTIYGLKKMQIVQKSIILFGLEAEGIIMQECPVGLQQQHIEKIAHLETEVENLKDITGSLSIIKDAVVTLTTLQKEQAENNKEFKTAIKELAESNIEFRATLKQVNGNLSNINADVTDLKCKFEESENKNKIDQRDIIKGWIGKFIDISGVLGLIGLVGYLIGKAAGMI